MPYLTQPYDLNAIKKQYHGLVSQDLCLYRRELRHILKEKRKIKSSTLEKRLNQSSE